MAAPLAIVISVSSVFAQVNLTSNSITFRSSSNQTYRTDHYGAMSMYYTGTDNEVLRVYCNASASADRVAVYGQSGPANGYGFGARYVGGAIGVKGENMGIGITTRNRFAGHFVATGPNSTTQITAGVYGYASKDQGVVVNTWAGYFAGNVYVQGTITYGSDERIKTDIKPLAGMLDKVLQLKPREYNYDIANNPDMGLPAGRHMGLIAQDVAQVLPALVSDVGVPGKDPTTVVGSIKGVDYLSLVPVLIAAIQEQQSQIATQQVEIDALKAAIKGK
jgi:hypothetical protein